MRIVTKLSVAMVVTSLGVAVAALAVMRRDIAEATESGTAQTATIVGESARQAQEQRALLVVAYLAEATASPLYATDVGTIDAFIKDALKTPDALAAEVLNPSGRVIADGTTEVYLKNIVRKDPTHRRVAKATKPAFRWERDTITAWAPITLGKEHIGAVWVRFSLKSFEKVSADLAAAERQIATTTKDKIASRTVWIVGIAGSVAVLLAIALGVLLTRPILRVTEAAKRAAGGDLDVRVPEAGSDEIAVLGAGFNKMLGEIKLGRERQVEQDRLAKELEIATVVQTSILPASLPTGELTIAARMVPASEVGGDYYDVVTIGDTTWIGIGDVSGHGLTAGLMMLMVQSATSAVVGVMPDASPSRVVAAVNRVAHDNVRKRLKGTDHMTFSLLRYLGEGRFRYSGAHEPMLVWRKADSSVELIETTGPWIGVVEDVSMHLVDRELTLAKGDRLILHTDGIPEAHEGDFKRFGLERLQEAVGRGAPTVAGVIDEVFGAVSAFTKERPDDQSLMVIEYI
jgi:serine phosphatase RsbU (regulator of sigma subunit)